VGLDRIRFKFLTNHAYQDTLQETGFDNQVYEGYLSLRPNANLSLDMDKKVRSWGKGYAWNPLGFISRPKDPDEPEASLEGIWDWKWSSSKAWPVPTCPTSP